MSVSQSIKVLHIEAGKHLYGGAQQVAYLLQGLRDYPVENVVLCPPNSGIARAADRFAKVIEVKMGGDLDFGLVNRIGQQIAREAPDIVHVHSRRGADLFGAIAAKKCQVPAVCSRRVDNTENPLFARWKYAKYQKVVCISEGIAGVVKATGYPTRKIQTIHSAVDLERYTPGGDMQWFRREFNILEDDFVIANFAQMIERKGQRHLIDAFHRIHHQYPKVRLLLFGKGPKLEQYQQQVRTLELENKIQFPGFRSDLNNIIPLVDLVVHPAVTEGLGVALLQSAACSRPIVATRAGGIPEVVRHEQNGLLVPVGDINTLAKAMSRLIEQPELRLQMGECGRKIMLENFSIATMARRNFETYQSIFKST